MAAISSLPDAWYPCSATVRRSGWSCSVSRSFRSMVSTNESIIPRIEINAVTAAAIPSAWCPRRRCDGR
jgi:hypothetical protein